MARLIDADALIQSTDKENVHMWQIALAPTVDPVKHGHWKAWYHGDCNFTYSCSNCGIGNSFDRTRFCPHCGAKMDEEVFINGSEN